MIDLDAILHDFHAMMDEIKSLRAQRSELLTAAEAMLDLIRANRLVLGEYMGIEYVARVEKQAKAAISASNNCDDGEHRAMSFKDEIREILLQGSDDDLWPPGLTMPQVVERLRDFYLAWRNETNSKHKRGRNDG